MSKIKIPRVTFDLTDHCNLRCSGCDQASPWYGASFADLDSFESDFRCLSNVADIGELSFAGGEPLQHPQFEDFLYSSRKNCFARELRVITNGVLLGRLRETALKYLDYVVVSLYPRVRYRVDLKEFAQRAERHGVFVGVVPRREFRHAIVNCAIDDAGLVEGIHRHCSLRDYCHTVHDGRYYRCPRAHRLESRMQVTGHTVTNREHDGIGLHSAPHLQDQLAEYLFDNAPLRACKYCLGTAGSEFPVSQLNRRQLDDEQQGKQQATPLIDPTFDPNARPKRRPPKTGWSKEVFESLSDFLDRLDDSGKTLDEFIGGSGSPDLDLA